MRVVRGRDLLQVLVTVTLLAAALHVVGGETVLKSLLAADTTWLALALVLTLPMQALSARRWVVVGRVVGAPLDFRTALGEYYVALLVNSVAPGGVAGEALRIWRHGRGEGGVGISAALHAVVLERAVGQVALAVTLVGGVLTVGRSGALESTSSGLVGLGFLGVATALVLPLAGVIGVGLWRRSAAGGLPEFGRSLRRLTNDPASLLEAMLLSSGTVACYLTIFLAAARSVGPLPEEMMIGLALLGVPLILAAMMVPISVGGLGPRETAAATIWPAFSLAPADGVAAALLYGAVILAGSLPGAFLLRRRRASSRPSRDTHQ